MVVIRSTRCNTISFKLRVIIRIFLFPFIFYFFRQYNLIIWPTGDVPGGKMLQFSANNHSTVNYHDKDEQQLNLCPLVSPWLVGWTNISSMVIAHYKEQNSHTTMMELRLLEASVKIGGEYDPKECRSLHKVAIIVPYRNRRDHLSIFLGYMHPFLQRQQLNYTVFVVEQSEGSPFNRGMLMNIGFKEAQLKENFKCFVFHDVDFLPENDSNPYTCPEDGKPRHMSFLVDIYDFEPTPIGYFGGVSVMSTKDFLRVNGFSNAYWGWGNEDDDLYQRILFNNLSVTRPFDDQPNLVHKSRYRTLDHREANPNPDRTRLLSEGIRRMKFDGLIDLSYRKVTIQLKPLYTHIIADIQST